MRSVVVKGHTILCVFDTKYKQLERFPAHDDVYQLFSHCSAMAASHGILIYPGDQVHFEWLGNTVSGIRMAFSSVRLSNLEHDLMAIRQECLPQPVA